MGIKDFTKVFPNQGTVAFKHIKNSTIAIDASVELYRTSLGMKSVSALTDQSGKSTVHINTLLANIIKYQQHKINQIWVFDFDSESDKSAEFHNPLKIQELQKRKLAKEKAQKALRELEKEEDLFSESEIEESAEEKSEDEESEEESEKEKKKKEIPKKGPSKESLEKRTFSLNKDIVNDLKFILNCFGIKWLEAPYGYESEQICACLTKLSEELSDHENMHLSPQLVEKLKSDYAWSQDADTLIFGAKALIKKNIKDKKYYLYQLDKIIDSIPKPNAGMDDLIKIGVILGCDFAKKSPGIGAKTVLKKYKNITLSEDQEKAVKLFKKAGPDLSGVIIHNIDEQPFEDIKKANILIEWLENKSFSKSRVKKQISKVIKDL